MALQAPVKNRLYDLEREISNLVPDHVAVAVTDTNDMRSAAYPEEAASLPPMRALRRREFLAGRDALRQALVGVGHAPCAIPMRDDRAPELPVGVRASLSHANSICVAVADISSNSDGLGIDIEVAEPLDPALWNTVCTRTERAWLHDQPEMMRGLQAKLIFCAKEAAYKCQFAQSGALLDFDAFDVTFGDDDRFFATFRQTVGPFSSGDRIGGRVDLVSDHVVAFARIPA